MKKINHPSLGGDVVDLTKPIPQRKNNRHMEAMELLAKGMKGNQKDKVDPIWDKVK